MSQEPLCKFGPGGDYVREYNPEPMPRAKGIRLLLVLLAYASLCSVAVAWLIGGGN